MGPPIEALGWDTYRYRDKVCASNGTTAIQVKGEHWDQLLAAVKEWEDETSTLYADRGARP